MNQNRSTDSHQRGHWEGTITALAFGGFLIIVGLVFVLTPNLSHDITAFFNDIITTPLPLGSSTSNIMLPAPASPAAHNALYSAVMRFDIGIGILQVLILALRLQVKSWTRRVAETVGNLVFWFGAAILVNEFLLMGTLKGWFEYWGALIVVVGISLVARAIVHFARR
jgi:hypothetical protein